MPLLIPGFVIAAVFEASPGVVWTLGGLTIADVAMLLVAYGSYMLTGNEDALRSETFLISRTAIEHGMYGDSQQGLIEPGKAPQLLPPAEKAGSIDDGDEGE